MQPLANRMRPDSLEHYFGQEHLTGKGKPLASLIAKSQLPSMILFGPPGTGKTTLAHILAEQAGLKIHSFNAVLSGVPELRKLIAKIIEEQKFYQKTAILFIDEIHRFNKSQQDALLPHLEK